MTFRAWDQTSGAAATKVAISQTGGTTAFSTNTATASISVTDDDGAPPLVILGGSSGTETDGQNQVFTWDITDASGIIAHQITVTRNGSNILTQNFPNSFQNSVTGGVFNFNSHGLGTFVLTVSATDADNDRPGDSLTTNALTRTVVVADDDTAPPSLTLGGSSGTETDAQTQVFTWNISDASGLASTEVLMHQNGGGFFGGILPSGSFNFDAYGLGTFVMSATATDADNDWSLLGSDSLNSSATRSVTVVDDDTAGPTITLGGSLGTETDDQNQVFTWGITDASGVSARQVSITRNGGNIFAQNSTNSGSFDFNNFGPGEYVLTVSATDADSDRAGDSLSSTASRTVMVTDDDTDGPIIALGGSSGSESSDLTQSFSWDGSDASGLSDLSVVIMKDGTPIYSTTSLSDAVGSFNFDSYGVGTYSIALSATDADGDWELDASTSTASRTVTVTNTPPIATGDAYSTNEDTPLVILPAGVLTNDTDAEGDTLTATVVAEPTHGTLLLIANGSFTYNPDTDFHGTDSFTYVANDGTIDSPAVTVTITVAPVKDTRVWDGGGADNNWSTFANWVGDVAPESGDDLVFASATPGVSRLTSNNDLADLLVGRITINSGATPFILNGNAITLSDGVVATNSAGGAQIQLAGVKLQAAQTFSSTGNSSLSVRAPIDTNGFTLTVAGDVAPSFDASISGSGGLKFDGARDSRLLAQNTYSGITEIVNSSFVQLFAAGTLGDTSSPTNVVQSTVNFSGVVSDEDLHFSGTRAELRGHSGAEQRGDISFATTGSTQIVNFAGTFTVSGAIQGTVGGNGLLVWPIGTAQNIILSGPNSYTGMTQITGDGVVKLGAAGVIPDGSNLAVNSGATLDLNGHNEIVNSLLGSGLITNGDSVSAILTVGAFSGNGTYSGIIQDGTGKVILSKVGSGTQTLSGNNTYTGATNVQAGRLIAASNAALGSTFSGTFVTGTGALTVGSGVTTNEPLTVDSGLRCAAGE